MRSSRKIIHAMELDISQVHRNIVSLGLNSLLGNTDTCHELLDQLLKILLEEKEKDVKFSLKLNAAIFIEIESNYLISGISDLELVIITLKNVFQECAKRNALQLQGQCLISMTTILLKAFEKINEEELSVPCTEHIEYLLSLLRRTNSASNSYVRSISASCLTEIELCFPKILKDCVDNIYTAAVTDTTVAHQQCMCLLSLVISHSLASDARDNTLFGKYPNSQWKGSFIPQEVDSPSISYHNLKEMISFLVDQLPLCSTEGVAWISMQIIGMMKQRPDLQTSVQILKPLILHYCNTYSTIAAHVIFHLESQFGSLIFQEKDVSQLLQQLHLNACHPSLPASVRLLYLDWLSNFLIRKPEKVGNLQIVSFYFPGSFDGPETHLRKLKLLSSILKNRKGSSFVLIAALDTIVKQLKCGSSVKFKAALIKVLYKFLCDHDNLELSTEIARLLVGVTMDDVTFTPFVLNFNKCVQNLLPKSQVPSQLLTSLAMAFTQPDSTATLSTFHYVQDIFFMAVSQDLSINQLKAILNYLIKYIVSEEVCGLLSWSLGHQILSFCFQLMCKYDTVELFYELCEVLKAFMTNCEDVDLIDRAHMYHSLLVSLPNKKLKEVLTSQKQGLTNIMSNERTFQSTSSVNKLDESILQLQKAVCSSQYKEKSNDEIVLELPEDILKLYTRHLSFVSQKPVILKFTLDTTNKFDINLQPIQALAIFFTAPETWGRIEPVMIGHFTKRSLDTPYIIDIECFLYKPYPANIQVCADFSLFGVCHMCTLEPFRLDLPDLFQPLPIHDDFISSSSLWRKNLFSHLWLSLEERSQTPNNVAFVSVYVLHQSNEVVKRKISEELQNYVVEETQDTIHVGIYLSPTNHLLLKFIFKEKNTLVKMATDDIHVLAHINNYFRQWQCHTII